MAVGPNDVGRHSLPLQYFGGEMLGTLKPIKPLGGGSYGTVFLYVHTLQLLLVGVTDGNC